MPTSAQRRSWASASRPVGAGSAVHSLRKRASGSPGRADSCSAVTSRSVSDSTDATGAPAPSASCRDTTPSPDLVTRTRSRVAPDASSDTPLQANGSCTAPLSPPRPVAWSAASMRAGCRANPAASAPSGRTTSANTSSSRRQAAFRPWNSGPYPYPSASADA